MDTNLTSNKQKQNKPQVQEQSSLPLIVDVWGLDEKARKGVARANTINRLKHGMMAQVPIVCRNESCPYIATCYIDPDERPERGRCPIEVSAIVNLFERYCEHLDITEDDVVDLTLLKDLIDIDIQLMRADHLMSANPSFVEDIPVFATEEGYIVRRPELVKAVEYKDKLRRERHRILQLLNSTRKDKGSDKISVDPSIAAVQLIEKAREVGVQTVIDITEVVKKNEESSQ